MATQSDRVRIVRAKIERASKHIRDLDNALKAFYGTRPYAFSVDHDKQSCKYFLKVERVADASTDVLLIASDALQNLRSSLDHLVFQMAIANGVSGMNSLKTLSFPIFDSVAKYQSQRIGKVQGIPPDAIKAIDVRSYTRKLWMS